MISKPISIVRQELLTEKSEVYAYILPAVEMAKLKAELEELKVKFAKSERLCGIYLSELNVLANSTNPFPLTEVEIREAKDNSHELRSLISELEANLEGP